MTNFGIEANSTGRESNVVCQVKCELVQLSLRQIVPGQMISARKHRPIALTTLGTRLKAVLRKRYTIPNS